MTDYISFAGQVESEGRRIRGSVQLKGSRTARNGEYVEVDPAALVKADASDVFALLNHDPASVLGRTRNKTLSITRTEDGISFETADLPDTTAANDALELARGGYFGGSSFAIEGAKSKFDYAEDGTRIRRITSIKRLVDVSPVYDPAFSNSSAAAFSKESSVDDEIKAPETEATPAKREPATFKGGETADSPKTDTEFDRALAFARDQSLESVENALDNIMVISGGNMTPAQELQYKAFAKVYDERKASDAEVRRRKEALEFEHRVRRGLLTSKGPDTEVYASDDYLHAFKQYLASTVETFSTNTARMMTFAQTIAGDGTQGGFTVPDGFINRIVIRLKEYGGIASIADEITTSTGESLRWPYIDDTANKAQIVSEDTQATTGADLAFDSIELGAYEYDATGASGNPIEVSLPLLQDSAFDIESLLVRLLGDRIGRKQADDFATGTGSNQPVGLLSKTADTITATVVSLAAPEHMFQVDPAYRNGPNVRWVMSDTSLAKVWTAQATTNEPLFQPGGNIAGAPFGTLFGKPIAIDNSAGNLVAFGDIRAGYIIRRVRGVQLLVDPYSAQKKRAVQYHAWARADANIQDVNAYSVSTWASVTADT